MILRRFALVIALLCGLAATQVPAFIQQYRQALGGAVGELDAIVANFDSRSAQHGLSEAAGIDRLKSSTDPIARGEGDQMRENLARLDSLRAAQTAFRTESPLARLGTFVAHYDQRIAHSAWREFQPAVPTTPDGVVAGLVGFVVGGGVIHMAGRPLRRRLKSARQERTLA